MKHVFASSLALILLAGCVPAQKEYTIIRETTVPATPAVEETHTCPAKSNSCSACKGTPAPTHFAGTYSAPTNVYYTEQPIQYKVASPCGQLACNPSLAAQVGANVINTPLSTQLQVVEPEYVSSVPAQITLQPVQSLQPVQEVVYETLQPMPAPQPVQTISSGNNAVVILQHPANRDLVKCGWGDVNCLAGYETQGYVQLRNTPNFTGYNTVLSTTDYSSSNMWREDTTIPRW